ncbi:MAG TPA: CYTH domain-containing protein [Methylomirabilota bacterium]|jgi:CYTH domain-containing protein|nr:CYTH domain-containing protein [Methylomirabilota bacterium]
MSVEIERKFLVTSLPEAMDRYPHERIVQGYVVLGADGGEVRLRRKGLKHFEAVKMGRGEIRSELEVELTAAQFDTLWEATAGRRIEKTRYEIRHAGAIMELDVYHGELAGLVTAECEFASPEESRRFVPPDWLGREVTNDPAYKNQSLAVRGRPLET